MSGRVAANMALKIAEKAVEMAAITTIGGALGGLGATISGLGYRALLDSWDMQKSFRELIVQCYGGRNNLTKDQFHAETLSWVAIPAVCAAVYGAINEVGDVIRSRLDSNEQEGRVSLIKKSSFGLLRQVVALTEIALPILFTHQLLISLNYKMDFGEVILKGYVVPGITGLTLVGLGTVSPLPGSKLEPAVPKTPDSKP